MRLSASRSQLLIIDVQEKLAPVIFESQSILDRIEAIRDAAHKLAVPVMLTEHYPNRIGRTIDRLRSQSARTVDKTTFSACARDGFSESIEKTARDQIIICGMEAHVCVMQTALDLLELDAAAGQAHTVVMVADAVGSRRPFDRDKALDRLRDAGAVIATTEMLLFEWLGHGDHPAFRDILQSIKRLT